MSRLVTTMERKNDTRACPQETLELLVFPWFSRDHQHQQYNWQSWMDEAKRWRVNSWQMELISHLLIIPAPSLQADMLL